MSKIKEISKFFLYMIIMFVAGIGISALFQYTVIAMPRISNIDIVVPGMQKELSLPNIDHIVFQQKGKDLLIKGAYAQGIGYTKSMVPTIYGGNTALVKPYPYYNSNITEGNCPGIEEGQIAVYVDKDFPSVNHIVHRVIDNNLSNGQIRFKGDNNRASEFVKCSQIKYIVLGVLYT